MTETSLPAHGEGLLALDIGGANIKAADGLGWSHTEPFELWHRRHMLPDALARIVRLRGPRRLVATMTGEIADCYASRAAGVADIVAAVTSAASPGSDVGIYRLDGRIVPPADALASPRDVAAANWHALARFAATLTNGGPALLVDVGSTTTDIVPLVDGRPTPSARDDVGRMRVGELVYTGVERTPVAALVRRLPWAGRLRPVASELFARSQDVWIILGGLAEEPARDDTADGAPLTADASRRRLARMLLADPEDVSPADAVAMAEWCADRQARLLSRAARRVVERLGRMPDEVVVSGHGECLARRALGLLGWDGAVVSLPTILGASLSRVAPAHALARIARGGVP